MGRVSNFFRRKVHWMFRRKTLVDLENPIDERRLLELARSLGDEACIAEKYVENRRELVELHAELESINAESQHIQGEREEIRRRIVALDARKPKAMDELKKQAAEFAELRKTLRKNSERMQQLATRKNSISRHVENLSASNREMRERLGI